MIPPAGATAEGCEAFKKSRKKFFHPDKFRPLGEFSVSAIGLGTYLGGYDEATDRKLAEALSLALSGGINFIDTAINYRCQRSERTIGRVLASLINQKTIRRDQLVVATKGGFIPFDGEPPANMAAYVKKAFLDAGTISEKDIVSSCHCLHPHFLQAQIDLSLANLGLKTIDLYYLHNPETELPVVGGELFHERLKKAFTLLEENVDKGKIQYYGLATWTAFREPQGAVEAVSLPPIVDLAKEVGGKNHHFKGIQLPYNLAMLEAIGVHGQSYEGKNFPILPIASFTGLSVMTSAPLLQGQLLRLPASVVQKFPGASTIAQKALQFVASTPSVTSAMVGMKTKEHVEENAATLLQPNWDLKTLERICNELVKG